MKARVFPQNTMFVKMSVRYLTASAKSFLRRNLHEPSDSFPAVKIQETERSRQAASSWLQSPRSERILHGQFYPSSRRQPHIPYRKAADIPTDSTSRQRQNPTEAARKMPASSHSRDREFHLLHTADSDKTETAAEFRRRSSDR